MIRTVLPCPMRLPFVAVCSTVPMKMLWTQKIVVRCTGQVCARGLVGTGLQEPRGGKGGEDDIWKAGQG